MTEPANENERARCVVREQVAGAEESIRSTTQELEAVLSALQHQPKTTFSNVKHNGMAASAPSTVLSK